MMEPAAGSNAGTQRHSHAVEESTTPWRWSRRRRNAAEGGTCTTSTDEVPLRLYPPRRASTSAYHTFARIRYTLLSSLWMMGASIFFLSMQFSLFEAGVREGSLVFDTFGSAVAWTALVSLIPFTAALVLHEIWLFTSDAADSLCFPAYRYMLSSAVRSTLRFGRPSRRTEADVTARHGAEERLVLFITDVFVLTIDVLPLAYAFWVWTLKSLTLYIAASVVMMACHSAAFTLLRAIPTVVGAVRNGLAINAWLCRQFWAWVARTRDESGHSDAVEDVQASERTAPLLAAERGESKEDCANRSAPSTPARQTPDGTAGEIDGPPSTSTEPQERLGGRRVTALSTALPRLHGSHSAMRAQVTAESFSSLPPDEWPTKKFDRLLFEPLHGFWVADRVPKTAGTRGHRRLRSDMLDSSFADSSDEEQQIEHTPVYHGAFSIRVAARSSITTIGANVVSEIKALLCTVARFAGLRRLWRGLRAAMPSCFGRTMLWTGTIRKRVTASGMWPSFVVLVGMAWLVGVNLLLAFVQSRIHSVEDSVVGMRVASVALYGFVNIWFGSHAASVMHSKRAFLAVIVFFCLINVLSVGVSSSSISLGAGPGPICCDDASNEFGSTRHPYEVCALQANVPPYGNLSSSQTTLFGTVGSGETIADADAPRSLDIIDFALFSVLPYYGDDGALNSTLNSWYGPSGDDWYVGYVASARDNVVRVLDIRSPSRNMSVIAFRGTATGGDAISDLSTWYSSIFLDMASLFLPLSSVLPLSFIQWFVDTTSALQSSLVPPIFDLSIEFTKRVMQERRVVLTGHSLGAAVANVVAASTDLRSVAFSPPGVVWSAKNFGISKDFVASNTVSVVPDRDPVTKIDMQGGLVQSIRCKDGLSSVTCHSLYLTACVLWRSCVEESHVAKASGRQAAFEVLQGRGACQAAYGQQQP